MEIKLSSGENGGFWEIPVLYEDKELLALGKPAGLPVVAQKTNPDQCSLMMLLHTGIAEAKPWATARSLSFLMPAHRLDAEASGVLLLAKNKPVLTNLLDFFGSERPGLSFICLVRGVPAEDHFQVEAKIAPHPTRPGIFRVETKHGKRARTSFEVVEKFAGWTLIRCIPFTHRLHQIPVHLGRVGLPVAGDEAYGGEPLWLSNLKPNYHLKPGHSERPLIGRPCLHAEQVAISHPTTGEPLSISSPWPKDLAVTVKYLRKYATTF